MKGMKKMKKYLFMALVALTSVLTSSCEEFPDDGTFDGTNWKEAKFPIAEDGKMLYIPRGVFPDAEGVKKALVGKGWKHVESHEIQANGKPKTVDYYEDMMGVSPYHYYFDTDSTLTEYTFSDAIPGNVKHHQNWAYHSDYDVIDVYSQVPTTEPSCIIQIIFFSENSMWLTQNIGSRANDNGSSTRVYVLSHYEKMTDKELQDYQTSYKE